MTQAIETRTAQSGALRIAYDDAGQGEPALLFMNGWGANRTVWRKVIPLASQHRRVINMDWRGHGDSETPASDFGASDLVADALAVIEASGAQRIVPVANAHSGWIAIELRRRLGDRIAGLALVDWIITEAPPPFLAALQGLQDPDHWEQARDALIGMWLAGAVDPDERAFVTNTMARTSKEMWARSGREIGAAYAAAGSPLKALAALTPPVPTLHVYAMPDDPGYLAAQLAYAAEHPWFQVSKLDTTGHFPMFPAADKIAAAIEVFVRGSVAG
ncbi:MAG TPA: alpha/beta hydrolase [Ktedonobacterales bacterium]|nr:alpha/beta hydrolase [Ktedonobacterales bacterium]